jgi:hypothetical protein
MSGRETRHAGETAVEKEERRRGWTQEQRNAEMPDAYLSNRLIRKTGGDAHASTARDPLVLSAKSVLHSAAIIKTS